MKKSELIKKLEEIEGDFEVCISDFEDAESVYISNKHFSDEKIIMISPFPDI